MWDVRRWGPADASDITDMLFDSYLRRQRALARVQANEIARLFSENEAAPTANGALTPGTKVAGATVVTASQLLAQLG